MRPRHAAAPALALALLAATPTAVPAAGSLDGRFVEVPAHAGSVRVEPVPQHAGRGALILDGGGYGTPEVLRLIVAHTGPEPRLCLIDTALDGQGRPQVLFRDFAGLRVPVLNLDAAAAADPASEALLAECSGYFFNGGDPERLSAAFLPDGAPSAALAAIRRRHERDGALLSGSSAGAMIAGPVTLCECGSGSSLAALLEDRLFQAPGFALLEEVLVDTHFFARGLLGRHMYAMARNGLPYGLGVDEQAAVLVPPSDGLWEVAGRSAVALLEMPPAATERSLRDFRLSLLNPGDRFDPAAGRFLLAAGRRPVPLRAAAGATAIEAEDIFEEDRIRALLARLVEEPAAEATGFAGGGAIRVTFRKTAETEAFGGPDGYSILRLRVSIDRVEG